MVLGKCAKIHFPSQSECNIGATKTVLMRMIVIKIQYFHGHTGILTEPMRHQNLYISYFHETIKALYYVFEFKCSKVIRNQKPGLGPCLSYKILRILLLRQQYCTLDLTSGPKVAIFQGRCTSPQKLKNIKLSLSFPCEIFCFKPVFGACSYAVSQFWLHMGTQSWQQCQHCQSCVFVKNSTCLHVFCHQGPNP